MRTRTWLSLTLVVMIVGGLSTKASADRRSSPRWCDVSPRTQASPPGATPGGVDIPQADEAFWWDGFGYPGTNGTVACAVIYHDELIVAGHFSLVGSIAAQNIARWDGTAWRSLGPHVDGEISCMAVWDDRLIVGGPWWGGVPLSAWDGTAWQVMAGAPVASPSALGVWQGKLVAGGDTGIFLLGPTGWTDLGSPTSGSINAFASYQDNLYVLGDYAESGDGPPFRCIARWSGTAWEDLGVDFSAGDNLSTAVVFQDRLVVGGSFFAYVGGGGESPYAEGIAAWNGTEWSTLPGSYDAIYGVSSLAVQGGALFAAGSVVGSVAVQRWNGLSWQRIGGSLPELTLVTTLVSYGNSLVIGGNFDQVGETPIGQLAFWDGSAWKALVAPSGEMLGLGMHEFVGHVSALLPWSDGLIVGGAFSRGGDQPMHDVGYWSGGSWSPLGEGTPGSVDCLTLWNGSPVAGGAFWTHDRDFFGVTRWNGTSWEEPGRCPLELVLAMTEFDGDLVAAGFPEYPYNIPPNGDCIVSRWDGTSWVTMGQTMHGRITALTVYKGELIAAGYAIGLGSESASLIRWNGTEWVPLMTPQPDALICATVFEGDLVVGGAFTGIDGPGGDSINGVARWDGTAWTGFGSGISNTAVECICSWRSQLVVGGWFSQAGGNPTKNAALWNGSFWEPLGLGLDDEVDAGAPLGDDLYLGGWFLTAGNTLSYRIARYMVGNTPVFVNGLTARPLDSGILLSWTISADAGTQRFRIYRKEGDANDFIALPTEPVAGGPTFEYLDRTVEPGELYTYEIEAVATYFQGRIGSATAIASAAPRLAFEVWPKVARAQLQLVLDLPGACEPLLSVFDLQGRRVSSYSIGRCDRGRRVLALDSATLLPRAASGVYQLRLQTPWGSVTERVVMVR